MEIGVKVRILPCSEYKGRFTDYIGTVERIGLLSSNIGIRFENETNNANPYGVFWFSEKHLEIIELENEFMNENFVVAGIKFLDGTDREYACALYDESIAVGDVVVVKTGPCGFALAKIASIGNFPYSAVQCGREVIDKVDFTAYAEREERAKRLKVLKIKMDKKVRQLQQTTLYDYELLAEKDPDLKAMLEEYKSLIRYPTGRQ